MTIADACPPGVELSRAIAGAMDADLASHIGACNRCRSDYASLSHAITLARELPVELSPATRDRLREAVLATGPMLARTTSQRARGVTEPGAAASSRGWARGVGSISLVGLVAALAALTWFIATGNSQADEIAKQDPPAEVVAVAEVAVPTPSGTTGPPATTSAVEPSPTAPDPPVAETPRPRTRAPVPERGRDEVAYEQAWSALRQGAFDDAAREFGRALSLSPGGVLAEDAAFWQAVSFARATSRPDAIAAFRRFLRAYPRSAHRGEANAALGWLLLEAKEIDEARSRFGAALDAPRSTTRASARNGLAAIAARTSRM